MTAAEAVQRLRALCDAAIVSAWSAGQRDRAQVASDLLDEANEVLAELDGSGGGAAAPAPPQPPPEPEPEAAPAPKLPQETFFLPTDQLRECLSLNIDASILVHSQAAARKGGWPLGKRRKPDGGAWGGPGGGCRLHEGMRS